VSEERSYNLISGDRDPVTDEELAAAVAEFRADNPGIDELQVWGAEQRLRMLNDQARERDEAKRAGTTVDALRQAKVERAELERRARHLRDLDAARRTVRREGREQIARPLGRSRWTDELFAKRWAEACARVEPPYTYPRVAPEFVLLDGVKQIDADPDYLGRLWRKHGRPEPSP
jgi:hypothetical protein